MSCQLASVILPVHNQGLHIAEVLEEYIQALARLPFACELLTVVNGPCRDDSVEVCRRMSDRYSQVRTSRIDERGWGRAVLHGLAHAKGDLLCYTNSARTTGEDLALLLLYGHIHEDCVVKANRKIRDNAFRRLGSLIYNLECRALFDLPYWDVNGTPKVFPRAMSALLNLKSDDDLIDLEFAAVCRAAGYRVLEVPILSTKRRMGKSTTGLYSALRMYSGAVHLKRSRKRSEPSAIC
jgi:glycosyltransferase involved in cell wall biosynthesis